MLKEYKGNKLDNFIKGWYIDKNVCDDLIKFFNINKDKAVEGTIVDGIKPKIKKSTDLSVLFNTPMLEIQNYNKKLLNCINEYIKIYPSLKNNLSEWEYQNHLIFKNIKRKKHILDGILKELMEMINLEKDF